jgi:ABC-2 type transport system ATP-binding protein
MKCELAAALLHRPKVLFLDEPTIGLDVNMQVRIREFVAEYNRRYDATVLLTSHYMADVTALCRRIIVVDHGHIVFDGDLSHLVEQAAPSKIIRLELAAPIAYERLETYGRVLSCEGLRAEVIVDRQHTREAAVRLLADLPVVDVTIEDPPIEEVIGLVFAGGERAVPQDTTYTAEVAA